jgi:hypothetical protein
MAEGREVVDFHQSYCKKPKVRSLDPFALRPKFEGRCNLKWLFFEEGSSGRTGLDTQTMVERPLVFIIKNSIIDKILTIRLEGLFWARNKVGCSFGFGLWAWSLEASHYPRPKASITIFYWLFSAHFLDSQHPTVMFFIHLDVGSVGLQKLKKIKSHGLSTSTAIVLKWQQCPNSFRGQSQKCIL